METPEVEYIALSVRDGNVVSIVPSNANTETALPPSSSGTPRNSLGQAVAKLTEFGYRIVPGIVVPGGAQDCSFIFMEREK
jgi:hypothetical protein